jgi:glycerophosphoryl diester phosphodiesterase
MRQKLVLAHRGASNLAHENTLEAFKKAVEIGAEIIELDVRKTLDGVLAVIHDPDIGGKKISDTKFEELNKIAASQNFSIPTLEQALIVSGQLLVQIEIKELGYELETAATALKILPSAQFSIISFNFKSLEKIRAKFPQVTLGLIVGSKPTPLIRLFIFWLQREKFFKVVDAFSLNWKLLDVNLDRLIPERFPITVWNLDEADSIKKFLNHPRVYALGSNKPDLALQIRRTL